MEFEGSKDGSLDLKKGINSLDVRDVSKKKLKYRKLSIEPFAFHRSLTE